jgi:hypothetical protein
MIKVKSGGMFAPQDKGPCKLTLIIPEDAQTEQNYAFSHLRYTDVVVGLASEVDTTLKTPLEVAIEYVNPMLRAIDEIMAPYDLVCVLMNTKVKKGMEDDGLFEKQEEAAPEMAVEEENNGSPVS